MNIVKIFFPTFLGILFKNVYCIRKHVCSVIIFYKNCKKTLSSFLDFKNEGGLCKPSESVDFFIKKTNNMINGFEKKNKLICQKKFTDRMMYNVTNMIAECYPNFMKEINHFGSDSIESHNLR